MAIVLTVIACALVFVLHYKNWSSLEDGNFSITSGIYRETVPITTISEINWVERIPKMERKNGFSWLAKEKGVFKDSVTNSSVMVFVDDLRQQKVQLTYQDSLNLYFNFSDSTETTRLFKKLEAQLGHEK